MYFTEIILLYPYSLIDEEGERAVSLNAAVYSTVKLPCATGLTETPNLLESKEDAEPK